MFLAKYLDQKQGEARVVDRQSVVRSSLEQKLKARPSAAELVERGILGRGQRFALARGVIDEFLRNRLQAQEAELARIPPGNFEYSDRLRELLGGGPTDGGGANGDEAAPVALDAASVEALLEQVGSERLTVERRLKQAADEWARCAEECRLVACGDALPDGREGIGRALGVLEAYRETAGASLKGVFEELEGFQRLTARRQCLERIVAVAEHTEAVREAVFACRASDSLPLDRLEAVPDLCHGLPSRSRALGTRRLRFVLEPLRTILAQELDAALRATGAWPRPAARATPGAEGASSSAEAAAAEVGGVVRLCADMQRVQRVHGRISALSAADAEAAEATAAAASAAAAPARAPWEGNRSRRKAWQLGPPEWERVDAEEGLWAAGALAAPLLVRFRQLFCRPESELCRMDKPEWAFRYLLESALAEQGHLLESWLAEGAYQGDVGSSEMSPAQRAALQEIDLFSGLAVALAAEARLFVRARMPLLAQPEEKAVLLATIQHLVRFHSDVVAAGGAEAGIAALADFDTNRPLVPPERRQRKPRRKPKTKPKPKPKQRGAKPTAGAASAGPSAGAGHGSAATSAEALRAEGQGQCARSGATDCGGQSGAGSLLEGISHLRKPGALADASPPGAAASETAPPGGTSHLMGGLTHLKRSDTASGQQQLPPRADSAGSGFGSVGASFFGGFSKFVGGGGAAPAGPENPLLAGISHLQRPSATPTASSSAPQQLPAACARGDSPPPAGAAPASAADEEKAEEPGPPPARKSPRTSPEAAVDTEGGGEGGREDGEEEVAEEEASEEEEEEESEEEDEPRLGFLDVWAQADAEFVSERLSSAISPSSGSAWCPRLLPHLAAHGGGSGGGAGEELEAMELSSLFTDLFKVSRARAECLSRRSARQRYSQRVLGAGLQQATAAIKSRWNAMSDPFDGEVQEAARLVETVQEICLFLDGFPLAEHFTTSVDEANELRISMLRKFAESLADLTRGLLGRLDSELGALSHELASPVLALSIRLRPSNFRAVAQQGVAKVVAQLLQYLQRQGGFPSEGQVEVFASNCSEDLRAALGPATSVLDEADLAPLRPLWDSCALLVLPRAEAVRVVNELRPDVAGLHGAGANAGAVDPAELLADPGSVLRRREAEALTSVGVRELSLNQALAVLAKRPDLAGLVPGQDVPSLAMLQELIPGAAAQTALQQLSAGALQHLGGLGTLGAAQATLQTGAKGVSHLRGIAGSAVGGAGALGGRAAGLAGGFAGGALGMADRLLKKAAAAK